MSILCKCGHSLARHDEISGCQFGWVTEDETPPCDCQLPRSLVESTYWWDFYRKEVYRLRTLLIVEHKCPDCGEELREEEVGLPDDTVMTIYRCSGCNMAWSYYGKKLIERTKDE